MNGSQRPDETQKLEIKEYTLYSSIFMKFKNIQN